MGDQRGRVLDPSSPEPLFSQLAHEISRSLDAGKFRDLLPSEHDLTEMYRVSRHTVRAALSQLISEGRLYSVKGKGTFVSAWHDQLFASRYSVAKEISRSGLAESSLVLAQGLVTLDRDIPQLGLTVGDQAFYLERVRRAGNEAVAINRSWFPEHVLAGLAGYDLTSGSIYEILELQCNIKITGGWEKIRAALPSASDMALLELESASPVLSLERAAFCVNGVIEWRESLVRDDRFFLLAKWGSEVWKDEAGGGAVG